MAQKPRGLDRGLERTDDGERGAALVEYSIVALLLLSMILGAIEMALAWGDTLVLDQATRAAARTGARMTNDGDADREVLRALAANFNAEDLDQVEFVVVYEAAADGSMPSGCLDDSGPGCNRYPESTTSTDTFDDVLADLDNDAKWGCGPSAHDDAWCPTNRDPQFHTPVEMGVYVQARRTWISGALPGGGLDLKSTTVMRLDPLVR